jgi:hypothetical protein
MKTLAIKMTLAASAALMPLFLTEAAHAQSLRSASLVQ